MKIYETIENLIVKNRSYKVLKPQGVVIHDTGNPWGDTDEGNLNYFSSKNRSASAHIFLDTDSTRKFVPYNEQAWHAGTTANKKFIGVECCNAKTQAEFDIIWDRALYVTAMIFINEVKVTTITKENLMSHEEVTKKWKETDHVDPIAYFKKFGKTVDMFRKEVQDRINYILNNKGGSIMKLGQKNQEVMDLQVKLNKAGYGLVPDGDFGKRTEDAVKDFQTKNGLPVTGEADSVTINKLREVNGFKDEGEISIWAVEAAKWAKDAGVIKGDNLGNFSPKLPVTREALAAVLYNFYKQYVKKL